MRQHSLVTGGAGFLGSHLCERLLADGDAVLCIDDFSTGRWANIAHLASHPRFKVVRHDVATPLLVPWTDRIFNLACPASPPHYQADPVQTTLTSVLGAHNMLDLARRTGARILQASTSEVYGNPEIHPQPESYCGSVSPIGPRACYDEGKRCAESLFFDYRRAHGVPIRVARIFNTYGPRMRPDDGRVVSNFIVQALRGQPMTIYGDGSQTRAFCYVDDMVEGLIRLMEAPDEVPGPINLGNPQEFTIRELAGRIDGLFGGGCRIVARALPVDDPVQRRPDITLARNLLDWEPRVALDRGLALTIEHFRTSLGHAPIEPAAGAAMNGHGPRPAARAALREETMREDRGRGGPPAFTNCHSPTDV
jgi:UDP-glucuronate decarboxylase